MSSNKQTVRKHTKRNYKSIVSSDICGCLSCLKIFEPAKVVEWGEPSSTALCPYCEEKQVIGSASGFVITEAFLTEFSDKKVKRSSFEPVSSKYRSSYSLPTILDGHVTFQHTAGKLTFCK